MAETAAYTPAEIVRAFENLAKSLERIEKKLDTRPSWADINRMEENQKRIDGGQDRSIAEQEKRLKETIANLEARFNRVTGYAVAAMSSAGVAILVAILNR